MSFTQMDGEKMYRSFLSGANKVISEKQVLNDINVFPVPDGDTGTNLASTMLSVIDESKADTTVKKTLESIAQAALIGAKGNSGIIFAQYIYGMSMGVGDEDRELDLEKFADSVAKAVPHAYEAIENPVEGTMITVIKDWSDSISQKWKKSKDFHELISESLKDAMRSLKDTPNKLKVLKDNAVVDSGGKGFVHFVEGFLEFVKTGQMVKSVESTYVPKIADHAHDVHEELRYRYCTEGFIEGTLDLKAIKQDLKPLGDSLIVAGGVHKSRIHIHTDEPDQVFIKLRKHGSILQQKADDMKRQYQTIHEKGASIALVTDSIADLPKEIIDRYKIHMIPLQLMIEGAAYLDKVTITSETFYDLLDEVETYPSSSQPNFAQVKSYLEFISEHYESIIVVTVAKALSGT
ncbi:MAG TPA: fatty acid-binding protein DegV, partial [Eubacteriaceae bacterium]|nr:fatty acid-binding protein DegV [Eubacteriaceae bacterium]